MKYFFMQSSYALMQVVHPTLHSLAHTFLPCSHDVGRLFFRLSLLDVKWGLFEPMLYCLGNIS